MTAPKRRYPPPSSTERALPIALLLHLNTSLIDQLFNQLLSEESTRFAGRAHQASSSQPTPFHAPPRPRHLAGCVDGCHCTCTPDLVMPERSPSGLSLDPSGPHRRTAPARP